jgi:hypothetical protein
MEQVTGLHRKSLLRLLHASSLNRKKRTGARKRTYGLEVEQVIVVVWESLDYVCAQRLTPVLLSTAQHLARFGSLRLTSEGEQQVAQMSEATLTRLLRKHRSRKQRLPRKGPERANQLRKEVPMKRIAWDTTQPGHFEVDLGHPSGESRVGEYAHTIQMLDVADFLERAGSGDGPGASGDGKWLPSYSRAHAPAHPRITPRQWRRVLQPAPGALLEGESDRCAPVALSALSQK